MTRADIQAIWNTVAVFAGAAVAVLITAAVAWSSGTIPYLLGMA